jgi:hypothetical protein
MKRKKTQRRRKKREKNDSFYNDSTEFTGHLPTNNVNNNLSRLASLNSYNEKEHVLGTVDSDSQRDLKNKNISHENDTQKMNTEDLTTTVTNEDKNSVEDNWENFELTHGETTERRIE